MCMTFVTIFSYNIIQAIIGWILVFIGVGLVLMCMGLEYLAFLTFVIYVGAISIIFLFVVMLLDIRNLESQNRFLEYCTMLIFIIFFFLQIVIVLKSNFEMNISNYFYDELYYAMELYSSKNNVETFSEVLYNYYVMYIYFIAIYLLVVVVVVLLIVFFKFSIKIH